MGEAIKEKVIVAVITAVVLGALTLAWNWASKGGVVRSLGGVTQADLDAVVDSFNQPDESGSDAEFPAGAVVAFDLKEGCPTGWDVLEDARGRMILGANPNGTHQFVKRPFRGIGGEERVALTIDEMPSHRHPMSTRHPSDEWLHDGLAGGNANHGLRDVYDADAPQGIWEAPVQHPEILGPVGGPPDAEEGEASPHNNMPPYIALYFCKKER